MILLDHIAPVVEHGVLYQWEFWVAFGSLFLSIAGGFLTLRDQVKESKLRITFLEETQEKEEKSGDDYKKLISEKLTQIWTKLQKIEIDVAKGKNAN